MIKAYIFDLFGTLGYYKSKKDYNSTKQETVELIGEDHDSLLITRLEDSKLSEEKKRKIKKLFGDTEFFLYDDSEEVIKKLKQKYKVAMISNVYDYTAKKIRVEFKDFLKNFDVVAISPEIGIMKPDPEIFNYVLNRLEVKPEEAVMVGDRVDRDIVPARELGMNAILIDRNTQTLKEII